MSSQINKNLSIAAVIVVITTLAVIACSWIGAMLGVSSRNLITPGGFTWLMNQITTTQQGYNIISTLSALIGIGVVDSSGLLQTMTNALIGKRKNSNVQNMSLCITAIVLFLFIMIVCTLSIPYDGLLRGIDGGMYHSPLLHLSVIIVSIGATISGLLYGLICNRFKSMSDMASAICYGISAYPAFLILVPSLTYLFSVCTYLLGISA